MSEPDILEHFEYPIFLSPPIAKAIGLAEAIIASEIFDVAGKRELEQNGYIEIGQSYRNRRYGFLSQEQFESALVSLENQGLINFAKKGSSYLIFEFSKHEEESL